MVARTCWNGFGLRRCSCTQITKYGLKAFSIVIESTTDARARTFCDMPSTVNLQLRSLNLAPPFSNTAYEYILAITHRRRAPVRHLACIWHRGTQLKFSRQISGDFKDNALSCILVLPIMKSIICWQSSVTHVHSNVHYNYKQISLKPFHFPSHSYDSGLVSCMR